MPTINVNIAAGGPLLIAVVGLSMPRLQALTSAGIVAPAPKSGTFLIDTGASCTAVDRGLLEGLGLQPTGIVAISTPSTQNDVHRCEQYDISLFIPASQGAAGHLIPAIPIVATHLRAQGIDGLIGRDVLKDCTLIYNGSGGFFCLAY